MHATYQESKDVNFPFVMVRAKCLLQISIGFTVYNIFITIDFNEHYPHRFQMVPLFQSGYQTNEELCQDKSINVLHACSNKSWGC